MEVLVFGDVHAEFTEMMQQVKDSQNRGYKPEAIIQLGDFGIFPHMLYRIPEPTVPFYFILGNHEAQNAEFLAKKLSKTYHLISPKKIESIGGLQVLGVSRSNYLDPVNTPPGSTIKEEDVEAAVGHNGKTDYVDIILTHDCPTNIGMRSNFRGPWEPVGCKLLNQLQEYEPRLWLFGHHHQTYVTKRDNTLYVGLPEAIDGYGILDTQTDDLSLRIIHNKGD